MSAANAVTERERSMSVLATAALAGTSIEWYDFFIYGTASALIFPTVFFPSSMPPLVALLASYSTFAVGFFARPVGGVLFGHFGDRVGRKRALVVALLLMGVGTTLIGCLPGYAQIGPAAPIILVLLRFAQGLAIGGQWGGAMLMVTESAPAHRRGFFGSFAQAGAPCGVLIANLAFLLVNANVSQDEFMAWGWRIPFFASVALIALGLFIQRRLEETAAFRRLSGDGHSQVDATQADVSRSESRRGQARSDSMRRSPVLEALRLYPREIALAAGAFIAQNMTFYIFVTWIIGYGTDPTRLALPRATMLAGVTFGALAMAPSLLVTGAISDRLGRRGIYMAGAALLGLWSFAVFPLIDTKSLVAIGIAIGVGQICSAMMYGPQAAFLAELFSTHVRYSAASLGYQLGAICGGGLAPIIATTLLHAFGTPVAVSAYMATGCAITLISVWRLAETHRNELR